MKLFLGLRGRQLSIAINMCAGASFLLFGYDQGLMGSIVSTPYFLHALGLKAYQADTVSTIVAIYDIGCMVGALTASVIGGMLGRKKMIALGMVIMIMGAIIQASSFSVAQMIVGRIVAGLGNGINTSTIPAWVSETSKADSRGTLVAMQMSIALFGIVIAYWVNFGFYQLTGEIVWRFPMAFQSVFAITCLSMLWALPESPRYLYHKQRHEEADQIMAALNGRPIEDQGVQAQRDAILAAIELEKNSESTLKAVFWDQSGQRISRRILLACAIQALQQLSGLNVIVYYSSTVFIQLGIADETALILGGVVETTFWIGSVFGIPATSRWGRRPLLMIGSVLVLAGNIIYTAMVAHGGQTQLWVGFAITAFITFVFGITWLSIPWLFGPELAPVQYRHISGALNAFTNWTFTFIIVKTGPIGLANIGWKLYIVYMIFLLLQIPIVYFFYPETKGKTLEQIDALFMKDPVLIEQVMEKAEHIVEVEHAGKA